MNIVIKLIEVVALATLALALAQSVAQEDAFCEVIPHADTFRPPPNACRSVDGSGEFAGETLTLRDASAIAWRYSPLLYFHPLERNFMADGARWIREHGADAKVMLKVDQFVREVGPLTEQLLFETTRDVNYSINANNYYWQFSNDSNSRWRQGDAFDAQNRSEASVYFNVFEYEDDPDIWVFNFYYWFAYQRCSNQLATSLLKGENQTISTMFEVCDVGVHDGDLENFAVMVCKNGDGSTRPLALRIMQHGNPTTFRDCSKQGECRFAKDDALASAADAALLTEIGETGVRPWNPIAFCALNSHALYDKPAANWIYAAVPIPLVVNYIGVMLVDRTSRDNRGTSRRFVPARENHLELTNITELSPQTAPDVFWIGFAGRYGLADGVPLGLNGINCVDNVTGTTEIKCPADHPFFNLVRNFWGFEAEGVPNLGPLPTAQLVKSETAALAPQGPYNRIFFAEWVNGTNMPLYDVLQIIDSSLTPERIQSELCDFVKNGVVAPPSDPVSRYAPNVFFNLVLAVVIALLIALVHFVLYGIPIPLTAIDSLSQKHLIAFGTARNESAGSAASSSRAERTKHALITFKRAITTSLTFELFWFVVGVVGFVLYMLGIPYFFELLIKYLNLTNWTTVELLLYAVVSFAFALYLVNFVLNMIFFAKLFRQTVRFTSRRISLYRWLGATMCFFSALYIMLFFVAFAVAAVVTAVFQVFLPQCSKVSNALDGVCLNLNIFGGIDFVCGEDIAEFCDDWGKFRYYFVIWGGVMLFLGGIYDSWAAISTYWHIRYVIKLHKLRMIGGTLVGECEDDDDGAAGERQNETDSQRELSEHKLQDGAEPESNTAKTDVELLENVEPTV
eukprot:CAMPEP_0185830138 /NCGR_PEP_ID=MMETSP1353-20130828/648_1 /TAXON_ID=1077150 /ORGANISM="Erythrolobus australicus, Strain CCMP3124" /LENGTH=851 /DNA_ID=CAMNT_0028527999 /DNA_START=156 /DNA_END=2711 /DNA_ORIENTATION=-